MKTIPISEFKAKCLDLIAKMDKTKDQVAVYVKSMISADISFPIVK